MPSNNDTSLHRCLKPLLKWLKWTGSERDITESLPHFTSMLSLEEFRWTMQNLGYKSEVVTIHLYQLDSRLFPCLFLPADGSAPKVLGEAVGDGVAVYDSQLDKQVILREKDIDGSIVVFKKSDDKDTRHDTLHWFKNALAPQKKLLYYISFLTFLQALLLMASPIFIIAVYDKVVAADSYTMMFMFSIGVLLATAALVIVMSIRFRMLAYVGTFVQRYIGSMIFKQLLRLPPIYTESAPVGIQVARLNDFNSVRDFFSSPLFGTFIELPFLVIFIVFVWIVGGVLAFIPLIAVMLSIAVAFVVWWISQKNIRRSGMLQSQQQDFLVESLWGMRSIQYGGLQKKWLERFREINSATTLASHKLLLLNNISDAIFDALMILSGLATLIVGAVLVMDDTIKIGALIGVMFIIWRLLTPIKTICLMLPKFMQLKRSLGQINELMRVSPEQKAEVDPKVMPNQLVGAISFSQVTFRYPGSDTSALTDINFSIKPGQMLALIGPSSAGKSTIAGLMLAMYTPQSGRIYIDGRNIKQYDVTMLRTHIAYVPQKVELFYGTVAQNLKLADPVATKEQLIEAATAANLMKDIEKMPQGFDARIKDYGDKKLGGSFCQKMSLARAYLRNASILILDEPSAALDTESSAVMMDFLKKIKGKKTIVLISHEAAHIQMADIVIALQEGRQIMTGSPEAVLSKMPKGLI